MKQVSEYIKELTSISKKRT